ncbi:hypothetical protein PIB30_077132 [Stylosanthes scabra]|uniref:Uncharacterized protein n=1 Tax=Stylosanthes scabra TaxID=79078 RepID=A0ABU6TRU0_9FABA|nr:hypothetical protein [Stylosanthes scabra]
MPILPAARRVEGGAGLLMDMIWQAELSRHDKALDGPPRLHCSKTAKAVQLPRWRSDDEAARLSDQKQFR